MKLKSLTIILLLASSFSSSVALKSWASSESVPATVEIAQRMNHRMDMDASSMHEHAMMMDLGPQDADFDLRFLDAMVPHHEGAIVMAEAALQHSQRPEIRQLAEVIIAAQQVEIDQMQAWRQTWYPDASDERVMYHAEMGHTVLMTPEMEAAMRMSADLGGADEEFDLRFINMMIPHHEGAVVMAEQVLERSDRPELQALAEAILATQQAEIDQMQAWRQTWYGQ